MCCLINRTADVVCGDFVKFVNERPQMWFDVVFLDLPWGGEDYSTISSKNMELFMGETTLPNVCILLEQKCSFVALKVPSNYPSTMLMETLEKRGWKLCHEQHFTKRKKKRTYWVFLVLQTPASSSTKTNMTETIDDDVDVERASELVERFWSRPDH